MIYDYSIQNSQFFLEFVKCVKSYKLRVNQRNEQGAFELFLTYQYPKITKNNEKRVFESLSV